MNLSDSIGKRGESLFTVLITRWCDGRPWFSDTFLGEKHETIDFLVNLIEPTTGHAHFFAQVKASRGRYKGAGPNRKLDVTVTREDMGKLKKIHAPVYIVGIDIDRDRGYIVGVTRELEGGLRGIPVRHSLNCRTLKALWSEVDDYWKAMSILARRSRFSL